MAKLSTPDSLYLPQMQKYVQHMSASKRTRTLRTLNQALNLLRNEFGTSSHDWTINLSLTFNLHDNASIFGQSLKEFGETLVHHAEEVLKNDEDRPPRTFLGVRFFDSNGTYLKALIICKTAKLRGNQTWVDKNADLDFVLKILAEEFKGAFLPAANVRVPDASFLRRIGNEPLEAILQDIAPDLRPDFLAPLGVVVGPSTGILKSDKAARPSQPAKSGVSVTAPILYEKQEVPEPMDLPSTEASLKDVPEIDF